VAAYEDRSMQFIISARKTARLVEELKAAKWKSCPGTDTDGQCEFSYQPEGWGQAYRFIACAIRSKAQTGGGQRTGEVPIVRHPSTPTASSSPI
jgi:hypothetical protein